MNDADIADNVILLELIASKICHDLISPVGAISNGIEILEELGEDSGGEVISLISSSAEQAKAKLKTMRMAYGIGGKDSDIRLEEIYKIFGEYILGESRISQSWDPHTELTIAPKEGLAKIILCLLLIAIDALPKGGVISLKSEESEESEESEGENTVIITAKGDNANFRRGHLNALEHKTLASELDPHTVHAYITGLLITNYGFSIDIDETENNFISLRLKSTNVS